MPINESINNCCFCKKISFQRLYSRFYNFRMYYRGSSFMKISSASWIKTYSCCQKVFTNLFTIKIRFSKYHNIIKLKNCWQTFSQKNNDFPSGEHWWLWSWKVPGCQPAGNNLVHYNIYNLYNVHCIMYICAFQCFNKVVTMCTMCQPAGNNLVLCTCTVHLCECSRCVQCTFVHFNIQNCLQCVQCANQKFFVHVLYNVQCTV